jgi:hypothetical protein
MQNHSFKRVSGVVFEEVFDPFLRRCLLANQYLKKPNLLMLFLLHHL